MRHQIDLLEAVAGALQAEAKYRQEHPGIPPVRIQALWRFHSIPPLKTCWVRVLHWPDWTLVVLLERGERRLGRTTWTERGFITFNFGAAPESDTNPTRSEKDRRKAVREMREILRLREFPANTPIDLFKDQPVWISPGGTPSMFNYKVLVIDGSTPVETIEEQLAVLCVQLGLWDESVCRYLCSRHRSEDARNSIIKQFTDPSHPGSYGDFVGRLRRAASRKTWERKRPARSFHPLGMTVSETSAETNIPRSTLYDMIKAEKSKACRDERGVWRIPKDEVVKLKSESIEESIWKRCVEIRAESSTISAARRWVEHKRAQGRVAAADVLRALLFTNNQGEDVEG